MGSAGSVAQLRQYDAQQLGDLVASQVIRVVLRRACPRAHILSIRFAQGKAFEDCRDKCVDFGLDGDTVLALNESDLDVSGVSRACPFSQVYRARVRSSPRACHAVGG